MPRPFKLTETKRRDLLRRVLDGATLGQAAREVGCCPRTVRRTAEREPGFAWRLQTALRARRELLRREKDFSMSTEVTLASLYQELGDELRQRWRGADGGDITATRLGATT